MTPIAAAIITGLGLVAAAAVAGWFDLRKSIGRPNGAGDITSMVQRVLDGQTRQDERLAHLETGQNQQAQRLTSVERRLTSVERTAEAEIRRSTERDERAGQ